MSESTTSALPPRASLPARPNLEHLKKLAKQRLKSLRAKDSSVKLAGAQLAIAREHGFASWRAMKAAVDLFVAAASPKLRGERAKALLNAVGQGNLDVVRGLLPSDPALVNETAPHPFWGGRPQPLHVAIERGDESIFRLLLDAGADVNGGNNEYGGWSPLMLAVHWKRPGMREELLRRGARVGLIEALMLGDNKRVRAILRDDPNAATRKPVPNDGSPLHFASTIAAAKMLIDAGAAVDVRDTYGKTPAETAAARGADARLIRLLLGKKEKPQPWMLAAIGAQSLLAAAAAAAARKDPSLIRDPKVINAAVERGQTAVVKWLLTQGADANARVEHNATLLHVAAFRGHLQLVRLLVRRGADTTVEDDEYHATPAQWARHAAEFQGRRQCVAVAEYLESLRVQAPQRNRHWKPLMDAAFLGDADAVARLLKRGADPNVVSTTAARYRPLHRAIEPKKIRRRGVGHERVVKLLLDAGADPKLRAAFGRLTALQLAATGEWRFVAILLPQFQPLDIFHAAAVADDKRVAELLERDGSLATAKDENGWQALHYCTASSAHRAGESQSQALVRIAQLLLKAGADPAATYLFDDKWPLTPLFNCCGHQNNPALAELLIKAGAPLFDGEAIYHAADEGHDECLAVIEKYADQKRLAEACTGALRALLHFGRSRATRWLLRHGADPNSLHPEFGDSALHSAVKRRSNDRIIRMLLDHGADPKLKNRDRKTAMALANNTPRILRLLQRHEKGGGE